MITQETQVGIRKPASFLFRGGDIAQRWERWRRSFERYLSASDLRIKPASVQVTSLLHTLGVEGQYIYNKMDIHHAEIDYRKILDRLTQYCAMRNNLVFKDDRMDVVSEDSYT